MRTCLALPLVLVGVFLLLTRTPLTRAIVLPRVAAMSNAEIHAESVTVGFDGSITLRSATFSIPGVPGPASEFLHVDRATAGFTWVGLLSGQPTLRSLELERPVARISQSIETERLNVQGLQLLRIGETPDGFEPPSIRLIDGTLEIGEHRAATYSVLKRFRVDGRMLPTSKAQNKGYTLQLQDRQVSSDMISVVGHVGPTGLTLTLDEVSFDAWPPEAFPSAIRSIVQELDLDGRIASSSLSVSFPGSVKARMELYDVAVTLPFDLNADPENAGERARMHGVNGTITYEPGLFEAQLDGLLEDLPYHVRMSYEGETEDSAFTCHLSTRDFRLEKQPDLLPFAPRIVQRRLESFSSPTAMVDADVTIVRAPPTEDGPGPMSVSGVISLRNGVLAYEDFPYVFKNVSAEAYFDDTKIEVRRLDGRADSGATVSATGLIAPPRVGAAATIRVTASGVPIDEQLLEAMGPRRKIIEELFSRDAYETLVERGLVLSREQKAELAEDLSAARAEHERLGRINADPTQIELARQRVGELERLIETPVFELGGYANVEVDIDREYGEETDWERRIVVNLPRAGVLPHHFPLPINAEGVVIEIVGDEAKLEGGAYLGLSGGLATIEGGTLLAGFEGGADDFVPDLRITARGMPVDDRLLHAIPGGAVGSPSGVEDATLQDVLGDLRLSGTVDCTAHIHLRDHGELGFDVSVDVDSLTANPTGGLLDLRRVTGTIEADETVLRLNLDADTWYALEEEPGEYIGAGRATIDAEFQTGEAPRAYRVTTSATRFDVRAPVEHVVTLFSGAAAEAITGARERYDPRGAVDATVVVSGSQEGGTDATVRINKAHEWSMMLLGSRLEMTNPDGAVEYRASDGVVRFDGLAGTVLYAGSFAGVAHVEGEVMLGAPADESYAGEQTALTVQLQRTPFESELVHRFVEHRLGRTGVALRDEYDPHGQFDLTALFVSSFDEETETVSHAVSGSIRPLTLSVRSGDDRLSLDGIHGEVQFRGDEGSFDSVSVRGSNWLVDLDGDWSDVPDGSQALELKYTLRSSGMAHELLAVLPNALDETLDAIGVEADGPIEINDGRVYITMHPDSTRSIEASGTAKFSGGRADVGVEITDIDGVVAFDWARTPYDVEPRFDVSLVADSFEVFQTRMTNGRARIGSGDQTGQILVPLISADCHRGRLSGHAEMSGAVEGAPRRYAAEIRLADVRFASALEDMGYSRDADGDTTSEDRSRGLLDGQFSVSGVTGDPSRRQGRGSIRIAGGPVIDLPLFLPLIKVSNLQLPTAEQLDYARGLFFLDGEVVSFEDLSAHSKSVSILGYGTMTLPEMELDLRFNSKAANRLPVVSDIVEGVRDELITTSVTGRLGEHEVNGLQFEGTRRVIARLFGDKPSAQEQRMLDMERRAAEVRDTQGRLDR